MSAHLTLRKTDHAQDFFAPYPSTLRPKHWHDSRAKSIMAHRLTPYHLMPYYLIPHHLMPHHALPH